MPITIQSTIIKGNQLGRTLGYPTANLNTTNLDILSLKTGIYAGKIEIEDVEGVFKTAVSVGLNSTFNQTNFTIEAYILDFNQDIYGKKVKLGLISKIREMQKFESVNELIKQIHKDIDTVKKILSET